MSKVNHFYKESECAAGGGGAQAKEGVRRVTKMAYKFLKMACIQQYSNMLA